MTAVITEAVREASQRFAIPEVWIVAVMSVESAGDLRATSPKGALGLMQLMPATWAELRARHGLGSDVFDPRDNVLAGTAYLRFLYDRFGSEGFIAAYNAGPGRYEAYLAKRRTLPEETRLYVTRVYKHLGLNLTLPASQPHPRPSNDWQEAPLFSDPVAISNDVSEPTERPASTPFVDLRPPPHPPSK